MDRGRNQRYDSMKECRGRCGKMWYIVTSWCMVIEGEVAMMAAF